jgi:hypothetical protein
LKKRLFMIIGAAVFLSIVGFLVHRSGVGKAPSPPGSTQTAASRETVSSISVYLPFEGDLVNDRVPKTMATAFECTDGSRMFPDGCLGKGLFLHSAMITLPVSDALPTDPRRETIHFWTIPNKYEIDAGGDDFQGYHVYAELTGPDDPHIALAGWANPYMKESVVSINVIDEKYETVLGHTIPESVAENRWVQYALSWDCTAGISFSMDGRLVFHRDLVRTPPSQVSQLKVADFGPEYYLAIDELTVWDPARLARLRHQRVRHIRRGEPRIQQNVRFLPDPQCSV